MSATVINLPIAPIVRIDQDITLQVKLSRGDFNRLHRRARGTGLTADELAASLIEDALSQGRRP